jgi:MFS family permease
LRPSQIEILGTVWGVAQGILILIFGPLSDRTGKRVIFMKIGLAGAAVSFSLVALTTFIHPLPLLAIYAVTVSTGIPFLIAGPVFALLGDRYGVQMVGAASSYFEGFGTGGGAFLFPLILGFFSISTGWIIIAVIFIAIFLIWVPQKEYKVNRSLVDRKTLNEEKEQKLKEFGLEP